MATRRMNPLVCSDLKPICERISDVWKIKQVMRVWPVLEMQRFYLEVVL